MTVCKFETEVTNGGNRFADCTCGWAGGVHASITQARAAWRAHRDGTEPVAPIPTEVHIDLLAALGASIDKSKAARKEADR